MNVVIYTRDMEPITIIDLPLWALELAERRAHVQVEVINPVLLEPTSESVQIQSITARAVTLEFTPIRLGSARSWIITTRDEVLAMLLRPSWLPGQRGSINQYERTVRELSKALVDALSRGAGGN